MGELKIGQWATLADYPAGGNPWNSQPLKVAPAQLYFTPNLPVPAENLNWVLNEITGDLNQTVQGTSLAAAANWGPVLANLDPGSPRGVGIFSLAWDAYREQWLIGSLTASGGAVYCGYDGKSVQPQAFTGMPPGAPIAIASNPTDGTIAILFSDFVHLLQTLVGKQSTGFAGANISATGFASAGTMLYLAQGSGGFVFMGANSLLSAPWTGCCLTSADDGVTWTNDTAAVPSAWQSGAGEVCAWLSEQSPNVALFAMCGTRPGTDTSRLMIYTTTHGFQDIAPGFLGSGVEQVRGIAYDAVDGLWGVVTQDNATPPNTKLYTASDPLSTGTAWTLVHTFAGTWAGGVACIGSVWCVLGQSVHETVNTVFYSGNVASAGAACTWSRASYADLVVLSALTATPIALFRSNGAQIARATYQTVNLPAPVAFSGKCWPLGAANGI